MSIMELDTKVNPCLNPNASLGVDEACFSIMNFYNIPVNFYSIASECYTGTGMLQAVLPPNENTTLVISTKYPLHIYYKSYYEYCHTTYNFKEHGSYGWNISNGQLCSNIYTLREPVNSYIPILAAFLVYSLLAAGTWLGTKYINKCPALDSSKHPTIQPTRLSTRIRSVDTFRGIAILLMIFVNNGGGSYYFFNHAPWFGLTVADLVLPWFAWIMGVTITISKRAELRVTTSRGRIILRCLRRSIILILLGLMINSIHSKSLSTLRFPGVLQLLAVSYFVVSVIETIFMKGHSQENLLQFGHFTIFQDILENWPQWLIIIGIASTHTLLTYLLPVPNCPSGYLGPGGEYNYRGQYANCTGGAAGYIDRTIFGQHIYPSSKNFVCGPILDHDPEGLMNTISAILIVYLGVQAGKILLLYYQCRSAVIRWTLWAIVTGLIAGILCNFDKDDGVLPVSKKMMTLSFDLTTSSFAFILFAILFILIDFKQYWNGAPFIYAGRNSIFLYVGHILTKGLFPWAWKLQYPTHMTVLVMNLWTTTLWGIIAYLLHLKDIIITV